MAAAQEPDQVSAAVTVNAGAEAIAVALEEFLRGEQPLCLWILLMKSAC